MAKCDKCKCRVDNIKRRVKTGRKIYRLCEDCDDELDLIIKKWFEK